MDPQPDDIFDLVVGARAGDENALRELAERTKYRVLRYLQTWGIDPELGDPNRIREDLCQEVLANIGRLLRSIEEPAAWFGYVLKTAHHELVSFIRAARRLKRGGDEETISGDAPLSSARSEASDLEATPFDLAINWQDVTSEVMSAERVRLVREALGVLADQTECEFGVDRATREPRCLCGNTKPGGVYRVPCPCAMILQFHHFAELNDREIAQQLQLPPSTLSKVRYGCEADFAEVLRSITGGDLPL